ncbi:MAG: DUF4175 family protein [Bacteroidota bacterium]
MKLAENKNILFLKLDEFIRKYYRNQLFKGLIISAGFILGSYLFLVVSEYFWHFETTIRTILFYFFLAASFIVISKYIIIPILKINKIGKIISYDDAAVKLGKYFLNVNDKLINTLQLQKHSGSILSLDLLKASIDQKLEEFDPIPFPDAINYKQNTKYFKFVWPSIFILALIVAIKPIILKEGTQRLFYHDIHFEKLAPFQFSINNKNLIAIQQQDYVLQLSIFGNEVPHEVFIIIEGIEHKMSKSDKLNYTYTFNNIQKNTEFNFSAAGFNSKPYELKVLPKPVLINFKAELNFPSYLNKKNEVVSNVGDLEIPQGTKVNWVFFTKNTETVSVDFQESQINVQKTNDNEFTFSKYFLQNTSYSIKTKNAFLKQNPDSINYSITVISDQLPMINVSEKKDSLSNENIFFSGTIKDDYGFSKLTFRCTRFGKDSSGQDFSKQTEYPIAIDKKNSSQSFFHFFDASIISLKPGEKIEYYFEVWDNDGVNGFKSARTQTMIYKTPSLEEINEAADKNNSEIKKEIGDELKKIKDLQKDINDLSKKLMQKKEIGYEEKKKLEDILKKQNELKNKIEETKQENKINNKQQEELIKNDENLFEKQKQLEQLFENIMTPEMKKLFDELNKLLEKLDKNKVQEKLDELKLSNKDIEKELDRTLEAFKQMEVEQKFQLAIDKLEKIKTKQDELKNETENKKTKTNDENLEQKQNELSKEFEELKKDIKSLEQKNESLEQKNEIPKTEEEQNKISKDLKESSDELNKKNKKEAIKSQKEASNEMNEMQDKMQKAMDKMQQESKEEDMHAIRQILENLLNLSFSQEDLMTYLSKTKSEDPQYLKIPKKQRKLQDDSKIVEDSLFALSKRNPAISATVNREISSIMMNMNKTISSLEERQKADAQMRMQYSMTSINNLALLLNESLEQMQQNAKENKKDGKGGACKKPGKNSKPSNKAGNKPSMQNMKQMQEQLNKQIEELKKALEKGQKQGGEKSGNKPEKKPGKQGGMGNGVKEGTQDLPGLSEQLAKTAAQQEALRRQMQQMLEKIKKDGGNNPGENIADLMEQTEKDIVNQKITQETIKRQQDIITKLLESEKAEREREQDEQRKSKEAKNQNLSNPTQFLEYKKLKQKEFDLLNTVSPSLTPFYKNKVTNYFDSVNK